MNKAAWVYLGLGSNLGECEVQIESVLKELKEFSSESLLVSSLWCSRPIDCPHNSPDFMNAVVGVSLSGRWNPLELLRHLQRIEAGYGERDRSVANSPRYMDVDILLWGTNVIQLPGLTIPHPRAHQRSFVMQPLAEIAPDLVWPGTERRVSDFAETLGKEGLRLYTTLMA